MGNEPLSFENDRSSLRPGIFEFEEVIGQGGFGRVWKVRHKRSKKVFALKEMPKARIIHKRSVASVLNERGLLARVKHPFIVNMELAFQDRETLFLVMDFMEGGDLRYHLSRKRKFTEEETRFFTACIVTGLEYLHINNIIHRDIKPENLVLDTKGYLRLTDFGIASALTYGSCMETSGTPGYMSLEVLTREPHGVACDYFSLGVIIYEFMTGRRPYLGLDRREIRENMLSSEIELKRKDVPPRWSLEAVDFVNKLLERNPNNRLGCKGVKEVKKHAWLENIQWKKLLEKSLEAPFKPSEVDYKCSRPMNDWETIEDTYTDDAFEDLFNGYEFDDRKRKQGNLNEVKAQQDE